MCVSVCSVLKHQPKQLAINKAKAAAAASYGHDLAARYIKQGTLYDETSHHNFPTRAPLGFRWGPRYIRAVRVCMCSLPPPH